MSRNKARQIAIQLRRARAIELKKAGATYRQIGEQLGCGMKTAWRDVDYELKATISEMTESADALRALELARLDRLQVAIWPKAIAGDNLRAVATILKVMSRRAALLGLDAPTKVDVAGSVEITALFTKAQETLGEKLARLPVIDVTPQIAALALSTGPQGGNGSNGNGNGSNPHPHA